MKTFTLTINGEAHSPDTTIEVLNPATESVLAYAPECSPLLLDSIIDGAQRAFYAWRKDESYRCQVLKQCAQVLHNHIDELARQLTMEQGKPLAQAYWEINLSANWFAETAEMRLPQEVLQDDNIRYIELHHRPLGVVAAITPWNYPIILAVCKIAPALLAGNTVVLKPSPFTPLTTLRIGELLRDVIPPGVFNVISGTDELGAALTQHPGVRKISFTGSIETGKKVAASAAYDLKRVTLELGGNDPAIVLPEINIERVAEALFWGALENNGQYCSAIKRIYVHADVYHPLLDALCRIANTAKVGNGLDPETQLGPLNNRMQFERVIHFVEEARRAGATVLTGGAPLGGPGYFYPPTLLTDLKDDVPVVAEEQFGPVVPILVYHTVEEVIERANSTNYGLGSSVWSNNIEQAKEVAHQLEFGTTWINQHGVLLPNAPLAGAKWSGIGVEYGIWGLLEFTQMHVINSAR